MSYATNAIHGLGQLEPSDLADPCARTVRVPTVQEPYRSFCKDVGLTIIGIEALVKQRDAACAGLKVDPSNERLSRTALQSLTLLFEETKKARSQLSECVARYEVSGEREKSASEKKSKEDADKAKQEAIDRAAAESREAAKVLLSRTYSRASSESEIRALQNLLNAGGCNLTVDGKWGPATSSALTKSRQYGTCAKAPKSTGSKAVTTEPVAVPVAELPPVVVRGPGATTAKAGLFGLPSAVVYIGGASLALLGIALFAKKRGLV